ncbi:MAG: nuclear transport factor 2 family protein [Nitrospira sp.]
MPAQTPEDICSLFQHSVALGELDAVLDLYDPEIVFLNQAGRAVMGREGLRKELSPLVAMKARFDFTIKQVVTAGDIALMHTLWTVSGPLPMKTYAIEVARRQSDGTWRWLIGDPFTVHKQLASNNQDES